MEHFIQKLESQGLFLIARDGDLVLRSRNGELSDEQVARIREDNTIISFIKERKKDLLAFLAKQQQESRFYKLSALQEGILFHHLYDKESVAYTSQLKVDFPEGVNADLLKRAMDFVVSKHSILRSGFVHEKVSVPVQCVFKQVELPFEILDFSKLADEQKEQKLNSFLKQDLEKGFDLSKAPLIRVHLIRMGGAFCKMVLTSHHIILDGWSMAVLFSEILEAYGAYSQQREPQVVEEDQYEEYIHYIARQDAYEEERFWKSYLGDFSGNSLLPFTKSASDHNSGASMVTSTLNINENTLAEVKAYAKSAQLTVNTILQGVWSYLLSRYTGQAEIIFGVTVSGRPTDLANAEKRVGLYINTLPLAVKIEEEQQVTDLLKSIQKRHTESREYQYTSLNNIKRWMGASHNDLFDSILVFENYPVDEAVKEKEQLLKIGKIESQEQSNFLLNISAEQKEDLRVIFRYNDELISLYYIELMKNHFEQILLQIIANDQLNVADLKLVDGLEKTKLLNEFNATAKAFPSEKTVVQLFQEQAEKHSAKTALLAGTQELTYRELDDLSDKLARFLIDNHQVEANDMVGIMMEASSWTIVAVLGILKAGAAFVPIEKDYPEARRQFILEDTQLKALLIESDSLFDVLGMEAAIVSVDIQLDDVSLPEKNTLPQIATTDTAYVIYTSGSTGMPKGVKIPHSALANYLHFALANYRNDDTPYSFPFFTPLSFDLTLTSLFLTLLSGGLLRIMEKGDARTVLEKILADKKLNAIKLTPSHVGLLDGEDETAIGTFILGGEQLQVDQVQLLRKLNPSARIFNEYGPTETTIGCTVLEVPEDLSHDEPISIGQPIPNAQVFILDERQSLLPIGVTGELYIGGKGLAKGYLNKPELTASKFIANPFSDDDHTLLYRTGDLGRWLPNGQIELAGRMDDQVKIRGHRVELGEIENKLCALKWVDNAVVTCRERAETGKDLIAYYQPSASNCYSIRKILEQGEIDLPERASLYTLPNGLQMYSYNKFEIEFVYDEIFSHNVYFKNGMSLPDGGIVLDIGANSGMFSVLAGMVAKDVTIYAFEPLPPTYEILQLNTSIHPGNFRLFNMGVSDKEEIADFSYYPNATVLSTRSGSIADVRETVKQFIHNSADFNENQLSEEEMDGLLEEKLITESFKCRLKTVSQIIAENKIAKVDYLKIDVEEAELAVLNGINAEDWSKISQIAIEVHDVDGRLDYIKDLLASKGYSVVVNQSEDAQNTQLYDLYARSLDLEKSDPIDPLNFEFPNLADVREKIRTDLMAELPEYMVPSMMLEMGQFPLTKNGKIDKKALPDPDASEMTTHEYIAPENELEEKLAAIWKELLGVEQVGTSDDFFELGGHSLLATRVVSRIKKQLGIEVSINDLFNNPTVKDLATLVAGKEAGIALPAVVALANKEERLPLSYAQERLWFIDQLRGSSHYHLPFMQAFTSKLDIEALEFALASVVNRHEALRTVVREEEGVAYQTILEKGSWSLQHAEMNAEEDLQTLASKAINEPFDLASDHMLRATLYKRPDGTYLLIAVMHHIASDGWSSGILLREFLEFYRAKTEGRPPLLEELPLQYSDYSLWQRTHLTGTKLESKLRYWEQKLEGVEPLNLPTDFERPLVHSTKGDNLEFLLDAKLSNQLLDLAKKEEVSLFMLLLSAYKVLLYRYSGQTDICVGTTVANRPQKELESLIGYFVNTLALRTNLEGNPDFSSLLGSVRQTTLEAYERIAVPFEKVVAVADKERDQSRSSLFQVLFVLNNNPTVLDEGLGHLTAQTGSYNFKVAKFDLTFFVAQTDQGIAFTINYCTDLFSEKMIWRMKDHFVNLLSAIARNMDRPIGALNMMEGQEKERLLKKLNHGQALPLPDVSLMDLFDEQVAKTPDVPALVFGDSTMTYLELQEKADRIGQHLKETYSLQKDDLVGIMMDTSVWYLPALLGVLKAGAAYVPIDPELPENRKKFILNDTKVKALIIEFDLLFEVTDFQVPVFAIDLQYDDLAESKSDQKVENTNQQDALAYVIYTSGTTGRPKGVMVSHRNLVDYYFGLESKINITNNKIFGLMSSLSADLGNTVLFSSLFSGGTLHLFTRQMLTNAGDLHAYFGEHPIDCIKIVPSHWGALEMDDQILQTKKMIVFGGEVLPPAAVAKIKEQAPHLNIINHYGPTETTIGKLLHPVNLSTVESPVPIGRKFSNTSLYIANQDLALCPEGIPGELLIGGEGVSSGYLGLEKLTAEKFIKNPFEETNASRLYRTGDLVRLQEDGNVVYLGRTDEQVKIRGYRVELSGIQSVLSACQSVKQSFIRAVADENGKNRLIAYIVPEDAFDKEGILAYLQLQVPDYMIPSQMIELDKLPLTANGKVNRKALPEPGATVAKTTSFVAAGNELESALVDIWKDLLNLEKIGVEDNFFELGGDSIIAIQLVSRIKRLDYHIQVQDLFEYPTITSLASFIEEKGTSDVQIIAEQEYLSGEVGLAPIQRWFLEKEQKDLSHFNQAILFEVNKTIDEKTLAKIVSTLVQKHDALRFSYQKKTNPESGAIQWLQHYGDAEGHLDVVDLSQEKTDELPEKVTEVCQQFQQSLDVLNSQLIKAVWIKMPEREEANRFFIAIHHLAVDGVSWRILMDDIEAMFKLKDAGLQIEAGEKTSSYRAWVNAMTAHALTEKVEDQLPYWKSIARAFQPLPVDQQKEQASRKEMRSVACILDQESTKALLQEVNQVFNTEINDVLLSALAQTICQWSGQEQLVIGLEGHGREELFEQIDLTNTVGWFTNKYPVMIELDASAAQNTVLKSVKEQLRNIPDKGMGYGCLRYLHPSDEVRQSLNGKSWEVVFNYLGQLDNTTRNSTRFNIASEASGESVSPEFPFDNKFEILGSVIDGQLRLSWNYAEGQYDAATVEMLVKSYKENLLGLIEYCQNKESKEATPSDFGLQKELSYQEFDELFGVNEPSDDDGAIKF